MKEKKGIKRRDFLKLSSAAAITGLAGGIAGGRTAAGDELVSAAVARVGTFPRRTLGPSGREVAVMLGAGDMSPACTEAGIQCGMNYWHKANRWMRSKTPQSILENREAHYCQVTVDRVGGDHYVGRLDEDEHVAYVKKAVEETGLGYFDDMQLHYGFHSVREYQNDRSFVRAFERLKKEGLVRHLCLSQHGYAGRDRVPGGQSAAEVLTEVARDGVFEHAQFIYSYGADPEMDEFIEFAKKKGFGTIAMKTARGIGRMLDDPNFRKNLPADTSPHHALTRWLTTGTGLTAAVIRVRNLEEFAETYSGAGRSLRDQDRKALELMNRTARGTVCRLCTRCQPHCPQNIPIADILRFERYALDDHDWPRARALYGRLHRNAAECIQCETCISHCPQHLPIPRQIARVHQILG